MTAVEELHIPGWPDISDVRPADSRVLAAVAAAAVGTDLAVRSGVAGIAGALLVVVVAGGALVTGRVVNRRAWPLFLVAAALGTCLAVRSSPWLLPFDILCAAVLLVLGASFARAGDPTDLTIPNGLGRALHGLTHGVMAPGFLLAALGSRRRRGAVVRGALLAAPVVVVLGLLLGSADPVFASFFRIPAAPDDVIAHAVLLGIGAWGAAGLLRLASAAPFVLPVGARRPLGTVESTTVLGGLVAVFSAFAASQVVAAVGGASYVRRSAGLSYADYARTGFFQLLAVAAITLGVLMALRSATDLSTPSSRTRFLVLSEVAVALTIVIVVVAIRRLHLYEQAYGLTMLRLCSMLFAAWIGGVFLLLGGALAGVERTRAWFVPAAMALALCGLLVTNIVNPEALVVRRNVERFAGTGKLDVDYLGQLSDDAVPALVASLGAMSPEEAARARNWVCAGERRGDGGFWAYNASRDGAIEARLRACPPLED